MHHVQRSSILLIQNDCWWSEHKDVEDCVVRWGRVCRDTVVVWLARLWSFTTRAGTKDKYPSALIKSYQRVAMRVDLKPRTH